MKTKLLKRLRKIGRGKVNVYSVTKTDGFVTGMTLGFDEDIYRGLFEIGDTEETVKNKAMRLYIEDFIKKQKINKMKPYRIIIVLVYFALIVYGLVSILNFIDYIIANL